MPLLCLIIFLVCYGLDYCALLTWNCSIQLLPHAFLFIGLQTYLWAVLPIPPLASVGVGFCPLRPLGTTIHPRSPWIHTDLFKSNFSIQIHIHFILPGCLLLLRSFVRQTLWARESSHNYINGLSLSLWDVLNYVSVGIEHEYIPLFWSVARYASKSS